MAPHTGALAEQVETLDLLQNRLDEWIRDVWKARPFPHAADLDRAQVEECLARGLPAIPEGLHPDTRAVRLAIRLLHELLEAALAARDQELRAIRTFVEEDPDGLIHLILQDRAALLLDRSRQAGLPEDLAVFLFTLLGRPFRAWHARQVMEASDALEAWQAGSCPTCGHWPSLSLVAEQEEGRRHLWCLHCGTSWRHPRLRCPFCGCADQAKLRHLQPEGQSNYRLQGCSNCQRYLKEIRTSTWHGFPWDAVYLGTAELDLAAADLGLLRESPLVGSRPAPPELSFSPASPPAVAVTQPEDNRSSNT